MTEVSVEDHSADVDRLLGRVSGRLLVVVAVLLTLILRAAREVRAGVSAIWTVGQQIANNTIHIALLDTTITSSTRSSCPPRGSRPRRRRCGCMPARCPGCPACVLGTEAGR